MDALQKAQMLIKDGAGAIAKNPFLRNFAKSATAGLSEPVAAALSAVAEEPFQWAGKLPERSVSESYKDYRGDQKKDIQKMEEESPAMSAAGDFAGIIAPGSAFNKAWGLAGKVAGVGGKTAAKLATSGTWGKVGDKALRYAVRPFVQGATANTIYQGVNPESRIYEDADFAKANAVQGGVGGVVGNAATKAIIGTTKALSKAGTAVGRALKKTVVSRVPGLSEYEGVIAEDAQKAFEAGKEALGTKVAGSAEDAVAAFQKATKGAQRGLSRDFSKTMKPLMAEHGQKPAHVEGLKRRISTYLKEFGGIDSKGNVNKDAFPFDLDSPEGKVLGDLARKLEILNKKPSIENLDAFQRGVRLQMDNATNKSVSRIYRGVYDSARRSMIDSLRRQVGAEKTAELMAKSSPLSKANATAKFAADKLDEPFVGEGAAKELTGIKTDAELKAAGIAKDIAAQGERAAQPTARAVQEARRMYAVKKPIIARAEKISAAEDPERVMSLAKSKIQGLTGSYIRKTLSQVPEMRPAIQKMVMTDILSKAQTPKGVTKAIEAYGADRKAVKELFGDEVYAALVALEKSLDKQPSKVGAVLKKIGKYAVQAPAVAGKYAPPFMTNQARPVTDEAYAE